MTDHDQNVLGYNKPTFTLIEEYLGAQIFQEDKTKFYYISIWSESRQTNVEFYEKYLSNIHPYLNEIIAYNRHYALIQIMEHFGAVKDLNNPSANLDNLLEAMNERFDLLFSEHHKNFK
jgi:hypothetical protein